MTKLAAIYRLNRRRLLPRAPGLSLLAFAAVALIAICTRDVQAAVITVLDSAATSDAMSAAADSIGQASTLLSPPFDQFAQRNPFWRLLACAGCYCGNGASAPSTMTMLGASFGGGTLGPARADFQLRLLPSWFLAEKADLPPSLMLASRPFHPPRCNG